MARIPFKNQNGVDFTSFSSEIREKIDAGFRRAADEKTKVATSKMTGKLADIVGISTNPLINGHCEKMQSKSGAICQKCYSIRLLLTARKNAITAWTSNTVLLSDENLSPSKLPTIPSGSMVRFNPHGELQNDAMMSNFIKIADLNPNSKFVLFTKRYDILRRFKDQIPSNLAVVASAYYIDKPMEAFPDGADTIFNVVTDEYVESTGIRPNCALKCNSCLKCWQKGKKQVIVEHLK